MAEVIPFQMVHYNPDYSESLSNLITPPYDVISPEEQESFYNANPNNIIRLVLGKQFAGDTDENNRYTRAANTLKKWMTDHVLVRKPKPGFTLYQMEFKQPDGTWRRLDGLVGLVKVDDYGVGKVLPHEKTYMGPKKDQLELLRACKANLTPIHAMFDDPDEVILKLYGSFLQSKPKQEVKDSDQTIHRTWTICDKESLDSIAEFLRGKSLFIADGHHRYETSLAYCREVEAQNPITSDQSHKYVMMYLTSMSHPGLTILPAHRMLNGLPNLSKDVFLAKLRDYFDIREVSFENNDIEAASEALSSELNKYADVGGLFGMVINGEKKFYLLSLRDSKVNPPILDSSIPEAINNLDVTILRELILGHGFGLDKGNSEGHIEYTPSLSAAINKALLGDVQVSFILNPTRVDQMRRAAELGYKLPHKSTYFYPKISSGLVLNVF
ncbi:MAG: DUF1015 domain-containing protein [Deltaproteobacteria bacterium]|nr:DUF1015 domain-containing protein [Deltaproteobacteria bacterium]